MQQWNVLLLLEQRSSWPKCSVHYLEIGRHLLVVWWSTLHSPKVMLALHDKNRDFPTGGMILEGSAEVESWAGDSCPSSIAYEDIAFLASREWCTKLKFVLDLNPCRLISTLPPEGCAVRIIGMFGTASHPAREEIFVDLAASKVVLRFFTESVLWTSSLYNWTSQMIMHRELIGIRTTTCPRQGDRANDTSL